MARKNYLWLLLGFFGLIGIFAGLAIWQIHQSQQRDRELSRVKTELEETTQQINILKAQHAANLSDKGKLIKDVTTSKKQLVTFQQKGMALEQKFKAAQEMITKLAAENSELKMKLIDREKQGGVPQPSTGQEKNTTTTKTEQNAPLGAEPLFPR